MKNALLTVTALCLFSITSIAAIWRVNNIVGVSANFTDLPAAVTAASNGDTIYLEPSPTAYNATTISKQLTIIGNGYFNNPGFTTSNAGLQANTNSSTLSNYLYFYPGSQGSTIMGCSFNGYYAVIYTDNITLKRNHFYGYAVYLSNQHPVTSVYQTLTGVDIRQNLFYGTSMATLSFSTSGGASISGVSMQNNIFYQSNVGLPNGISGFMQNNMFYGATVSAFNFQINNNIMDAGSFTPNNSVYFNNISTSTQFGNANNNQQNVGTASLFTNYAATTETRYTLNPSGPGIGAGFNGVNVGIFGGPDPYKLSGIPPVPTIYLFSAPATTTTSTLPVTISTRSND